MPKSNTAVHVRSAPIIGLSSTYAALYVGVGIHLPFFPLWLAGRGFGPAEIALFLSSPLIVRVVIMPLTTNLADRIGDLRLAMAGYAAAAAVCMALYLTAYDFSAILILSILVGITWSTVTPILEGMTLSLAALWKFDYGRVRVWGSVAFVATSVGAGILIERAGIGVVVPMMAAALVALAAIAWSLPAPPSDAPKQRAPHLIDAWRGMARVPGLPALLAGAALVQASHNLLYTFGSIHWKTQGLTETWIGILWGIGVVAEIVFFAYSGRVLAAAGPILLLVVSSTFAVGRFAVMAFDPGLGTLIALQVTHAASFAATHLASAHLINRSVEPRFAATAQGAYFTIHGILNGSVLFASGPIYAALGGAGQGVMAVIAAAGLGLALLGLRQARRQPQSAGAGG